MEQQYNALTDLIEIAGEDYCDHYEEINRALSVLLILVSNLRQTKLGTIFLDSDKLTLEQEKEIRDFVGGLDNG